MKSLPYQRKPIEGFPGYEIDSNGDIFCCLELKQYGGRYGSKSFISNNWRKLKQIIGYDSRELKKGRKFIKSCHVTPRKNGKTYRKSVHRLVAEAFIPNPSNYKIVCHIDSDPKNNNVENLRWDNQIGNMIDRKQRGLYGLNKGSKNGSAKLDEEKVIIIKNKIASGATDTQLGKQSGVHRRTINDIRFKRCWSHI